MYIYNSIKDRLFLYEKLVTNNFGQFLVTDLHYGVFQSFAPSHDSSLVIIMNLISCFLEKKDRSETSECCLLHFAISESIYHISICLGQSRS